MQELPDKLYSVDSIVKLEKIAIDQFDIPAYELMKRAGRAVFEVIITRYSTCKNILVLCGAGNNAGDGYVVARLAKKHGYHVRLVSLIGPDKLSGAARQAYTDWTASCATAEGATTETMEQATDDTLLTNADIIVDALLGTGLKRELSAGWLGWMQAVNRTPTPVISVDIPSGLYADTGSVAGDAIQADITVCFIGLKQGMFTAQARDFCGEVICCDLDLPDAIFSMVKHDARLLTGFDKASLPARKPSSNKGCFGHVLIVGGNSGMPGAAILAARAALRTGAGLVTILTLAQHLSAITNAVPEVMIKICAHDASEEADCPSVEEVFRQPFIDDITHVAAGMGLGRDEWALSVLRHCLKLEIPALIDADGLNLLAEHSELMDEISLKSLVITPHPGEASRLLSAKLRSLETGSTESASIQPVSTKHELTAADVQKDRFAAVKNIHQMFQLDEFTVVLKGSGTLIFDGDEVKICKLGNAAMSAPGMGDVLSGIIIALQAQSISFCKSAELGVCLHALVAQNISGQNTRGLLASDVIDALPQELR